MNREFRVTCGRERAEYLARIPHALARTDWRLLGYVVMSSHVHLLAIAGGARSSQFVQALHCGFAGWLNRRHDRLGPLFAERHTTVIFDEERAARLIAYLHNNPVRAMLVRDAAATDWSSQREYLDEAIRHAWLSVEAGLALSGFDDSPSGRLGLHEFVRSQSGVTAQEMRDQGLTAARAIVRRKVGAAVELSSVQVEGCQPRVQILAPAGTRLRPSWEGDPQRVLEAVADRVGVPVAVMQSRNQRRRVVRARRLALRVWTTHLGRTQISLSGVLGLSQQAASHLLDLHELDGEADQIARLVRANSDG